MITILFFFLPLSLLSLSLSVSLSLSLSPSLSPLPAKVVIVATSHSQTRRRLSTLIGCGLQALTLSLNSLATPRVGTPSYVGIAVNEGLDVVTQILVSHFTRYQFLHNMLHNINSY